MAYCRKCGKLLSDGANHCTVCGAPALQQSQGQDKFDTGRIPRVGIPPNYQQPGVPPQYQQPQYPPQPVQPPRREPAPQPPERPRKKKKNGTLITLYILLGILVAALLGIGGFLLWSHFHTESEDPAVGTYDIVSCIQDGEVLPSNGEWIRLESGGEASLHLDGETTQGEWTLEDTELTLSMEDKEYEATLEDDTITLEDGDKTYTFRKDAEVSGSAQGAGPRETEAAPRDLSWWEGNWYGWWIVTEGSGELYLMEGAAFDVCSTIVLGEDSTGTLTMWDHQQGSDQALWNVNVSFPEGSDGQSSMVSQSGTFLGAEVGYNDLYVSSTEYPYSNFTDMICIRGTYQDPSDPDNRCSYSVFLRPWGTEWEDIRGGDMTDMPYPDMLPIGYDSWYLPLIREGQEMPNAF